MAISNMQMLEGGGGVESSGSSDGGDERDLSDRPDRGSSSNKEFFDQMADEGGVLIEKDPFADLIRETEKMARDLGLPQVEKPTSEAETFSEFSGSTYRNARSAARLSGMVATRYSFGAAKLGLSFGKALGPWGWAMTGVGAVVGFKQRTSAGTPIVQAAAEETVESIYEIIAYEFLKTTVETVYSESIEPNLQKAMNLLEGEAMDIYRRPYSGSW